jgi:cbb3-type cytochrome oxidase subunit 3
MNDAVMIGVVLTLVFGAVIFYLYNRLTMTERKLGLFEGILTDLKIMMDAAPYSPSDSGCQANHQEFEPTPEYLNAISGPFPLKEDEVDEVVSEDDYKNVMDEATKSLKIDEIAGSPITATNAINVTKLSPDLEIMTIRELQSLAKDKGLTIPAGSRKKDIISLLKGSDSPSTTTGVSVLELDGPEQKGGAPLSSNLE